MPTAGRGIERPSASTHADRPAPPPPDERLLARMACRITTGPAGAARVGMRVERTHHGLAARVVQRDVGEVAWLHMEGEYVVDAES